MKNLRLLTVFAVIGLTALTACSRRDYATQFDKLKNECERSKKDKGTPAGKCASWYPVKERTITNTIVTEGKPVITEVPGATVYVDCDSVMKATLDEASRKHVAVRTPAVRYSIKVDTVHRYDSVYVENTAKVEYQQHLLNAKDEEIATFTSKYHTARKWAIGLGLLALVFIVLFMLGIKGKLR